MTDVDPITVAQHHDGSIQILAIDASGEQASVALWRNGALLAQTAHNAKQGHATTLVPMVQNLLGGHDVSFDTLTHVAAGIGPGSFTGIRVALATAKGFCLATGASPIGVSVLAANAYAAAQADLNKGHDMIILADTRRRSIYAQRFDPSGRASSEIIESDSQNVLSALSADSTSVAIAGPMQLDVPAAAQLSHFAMDGLPLPNAGQIAALAAAQIDQDMPFTALTPLYLAPAFLGPKRVA